MLSEKCERMNSEEPTDYCSSNINPAAILHNFENLDMAYAEATGCIGTGAEEE
jgi:hypothetical protein